jgi:uncharacterized protein (TIGR03118 family)
MKRVLLVLFAGGLAASCGVEPDSTDVATEVGTLKAGPTNRIAALVEQENYVSDQPGVAEATDPELINAWGLAFNPAGPAWVSSNGEGLSLVLDSEGNRLLRVVIPTAKGGQPPSAPTGQVFNGDPNSFKGDVFIFVTEDGTVSGWQPAFGTNAQLRADRSKREAIYKGVTIAECHGRLRLYAADFHNNRIDMFDDNYRLLRRHDQHDRDWGKHGDDRRDDDSFVDRHLPDGFAPFNIIAHGDLLFVSYAKQDADAEDDVAGPGNGFVDVFDTDGDFVQRLISRGVLDSPWGMAFQPPPAGKKSERLLVGNFGDGRVNVFKLERKGDKDGKHLRAILKGTLGDAPDHPLVIEGLWALVFGLGAGGFDADDLYFTAGPGNETHGLFGEIGFVEEDASEGGEE